MKVKEKKSNLYLQEVYHPVWKTDRQPTNGSLSLSPMAAEGEAISFGFWLFRKAGQEYSEWGRSKLDVEKCKTEKSRTLGVKERKQRRSTAAGGKDTGQSKSRVLEKQEFLEWRGKKHSEEARRWPGVILGPIPEGYECHTKEMASAILWRIIFTPIHSSYMHWDATSRNIPSPAVLQMGLGWG